jgi:hypothetical protein
MAAPDVRNLAYLNSIPGFGHHLVQALKDLRKLAQNIGQQTNAYPNGQETPPPPKIHAVSVVASGGVAHVQITDNNAVYRGIGYHVDISPDASWSAPVTIHMGPSRDVRIPVGTQALHYRVFSDYPTSGPSEPVYFGGPVTASGTAQPPIPAGQGSGTGYAGQISGHGPVPYRGATPPRRS